jgi:hypothetical protein
MFEQYYVAGVVTLMCVFVIVLGGTALLSRKP